MPQTLPRVWLRSNAGRRSQTVNDEIETEGEDDRLEVGGALTLVFTAEGGCVLEEDEEPVWFSDDDDDFAEKFGNDFLTADQDAQDVLDWLEDEGYLESEEKPEVAIEEENENSDEDGEERISHN